MVENLLEIENSGPTIEAAVEKGLIHLGCSRAEVKTTIIQTPSSGLFGLFGSRPAQVRIRLTDRALTARVIAEKILRLSGFHCTVDVHLVGEQIHLRLEGIESRLIVGRHGQTLEALQTLVVLLTDREMSDRTPIILDVGDYGVRRGSSLRRLARHIAAQVRRTGRAASVQPFPPEERRILHLAFKDESGIETRSVGQGYERKIVVSISRG